MDVTDIFKRVHGNAKFGRLSIFKTSSRLFLTIVPPFSYLLPTFVLPKSRIRPIYHCVTEV